LSTYRYAAYGSNLHPQRLKKRAASATLIGTSFLPSWALRFSKKSDKDGTGKCTISRNGDGIYLAIFEIDNSERVELDRCEGLGCGYNNLTIDDPNFGVCTAYIADERSVDESLIPVDWYKEFVILGCEYNRFPHDYVEWVRNTQSCEDSDKQRRQTEWALVEEIRRGNSKKGLLKRPLHVSC